MCGGRGGMGGGGGRSTSNETNLPWVRRRERTDVHMNAQTDCC